MFIYTCMNSHAIVIKCIHKLHVQPLGYLALRARICRLKIFDPRGTLPAYLKWFVKEQTLKEHMYGYQNQKCTVTRLGWYLSNKIKHHFHIATLHKYYFFVFCFYSSYIYVLTIYVNKMSPYSNSNYLSSTVSIVITLSLLC